MKKTALHILIIFLCGHSVFAQIGLNTDNSSPDPSSILDIKFTDKGVLIPRITSAMRTAIEDPAPGLLVYQTDEPEGFWFYNGTAWSQVISTRGAFSPNYLPKYTIKDTLAGSILYDNNNGIGAGTAATFNKHLSFPVNSGISWGNQYSRIVDNTHLHFITDDSLLFDDNYNGTRMFINTNTGQVGIGTTSPDRTLDVNGVTRSRTTSGSANAAGQFQSIVAGTAQGQQAVYSFYPTFGNTGDNGPRRAADILAGYNGGAWSKEYLSFNVGSNGSANDAQNLTSEKMRITGNGNIGIGTTSPNASALLDVTSSSRGFLLPRMTAEKIMEIAAPANGLMVFCTTNNKFYSFNSGTSTWKEISGGTSFLIPGTCGGSFTVSHIAGNVAPVDKTVTYGTVTNVPGEPEKCWITRNLGASQQATAVNDATEASAGWYWQFNQVQGYKHDGITRTPNTWVYVISENTDWIDANDPCVLLLGSGWRLPTLTEWDNVRLDGNWSNWNDAYNSPLKIHAAGHLHFQTGDLDYRGVCGYYWSKEQYSTDYTYAYYLASYDENVATFIADKPFGYSLRCIRCVNPSSPVEGTHVPSENQVIWNWNSQPNATGYKWHTSNDYNAATDMGTSTTKTDTGLLCGVNYARYVWAYNACGYSAPTIMYATTQICEPTVTTYSIANLGDNASTGGGTVTHNGGASVTARGVCWSTSANPTITNSKTIDGIGTGGFTSYLTGLNAGTLYYVRAYATNSEGTAYGDEVSFITCNPESCGTLYIQHMKGNVAPVTCQIAYGTVKNISGEPDKCWITQNLGASTQAISKDDNNWSRAGWYWQFNRRQGYDFTTSRRPNTTWQTLITESTNWLQINDPCTQLLESAWRLPTSTEWANVDAAGLWTNWNGPWNSPLRIHAAGKLNNADGSLSDRGIIGFYTSSNQSNNPQYAKILSTDNNISEIAAYYPKSNGFSVRCLKCAISSPSGASHLVSANRIIWKWHPEPDATGYKWNTSSNYNTAIDLGADTTWTENGLSYSTSYTRYVWGYNACGYDAVPESLTATTLAFTCGTDSMYIDHVADATAPVNKTVPYGTVMGIPGETSKCWITQNLGANNQATAKNDATEASAGWYWQFNRSQGYKHDGATRTPNTSWITSFNEDSDWLAANDPCSLELGNDWRIPTSTEWTNVDASGNWAVWDEPYNSALKMHAAGYLVWSSGDLNSRGASGAYWSSSQLSSDHTRASNLDIFPTFVGMVDNPKSQGFTIRCISCPLSIKPIEGTHMPTADQIIWKWKDAANVIGYKWNTTDDYLSAVDIGNDTSFTEAGLNCLTNYTRYVWSYNYCGVSLGTALNQSTLASVPSITTVLSNIGDTAAISGGNVSQSCGSAVTERGVCWSTLPNPTISDDHTIDWMGTGTYESFITGLSPGTPYYVRAYATNSVGTGYGDELLFTTPDPVSCGSLNISHVAGDVAPVSKSVVYNSVSGIPGELTKCWITSNLGADNQANAKDDATEASAGWYWQFNRKQGYKHDGTDRTPNTAWITSIDEDQDWIAANDPCTIELANGWRIPTRAEWTNIKNSSLWTNWNGPWNSPLRIHAAGRIGSDGTLNFRGEEGNYWSGVRTNSTNAYHLQFNSTTAVVGNESKARGESVRCVRE